MKIYAEEYFLDKILECTREELSIAKQEAFFCPATQIPKKNGTRIIVSMDGQGKLVKLQRNLHRNFLSRLPVSPAACGFRKGSSYVDFLEEHAGSRYFLRLDIQSFFDSIPVESFHTFLEEYVEEKKGEDAMDIRREIVALCTVDQRIPQGFITSPVISNLIFRRIDQRIRKYCRAYYKERIRQIHYTRYADDMLFSSDTFDFRQNKGFKAMIGRILWENGFACNESKTIYQANEISLSGYVVGEDIHLSRKKLRTLNEIIYCFDGRRDGMAGSTPFFVKQGVKAQEVLREINGRKLRRADGQGISFGSLGAFNQFLAGYRSYLIQIARMDHGGTGFGRQLSGKIRKLEMIMDFLAKEMGDCDTDGRRQA